MTASNPGGRSARNWGATKPATLQTVAALAGVSTATVSKALNGLTVSAQNLQRVRAAADELGYVANSAARSMRRAQTMTIGIFMRMDLHPATELIRILNSAIVDLERAGYTVLLSVERRDVDVAVDVALRRFVERRVDGLFYWNAVPAASLALYQQAQIPVLAIGFRDPGCSNLPLITVDTAPACREAMEQARLQGHRVVAEFAQGIGPAIMESAAREAGLTCYRPHVGFDQADVTGYVRSLAQMPEPPTLLIGHYSSALQVLHACEEIGLGIPRDLSVISTTDSEGASLLRTPLSALDTDYSMLGHVSASAMLKAIDGESLEDVVLDESVRWIDRLSIGPAPLSAEAPRRRAARKRLPPA